MTLTVSNESALPIYRQLYDQISHAILRGELHSADALPTIRTVASELRISVIGVKRAWEELERDGYIVTAVGRGSFVAALDETALREKRLRLLRERMEEYLRCAKSVGASEEELALIAEESTLPR